MEAEFEWATQYQGKIKVSRMDTEHIYSTIIYLYRKLYNGEFKQNPSTRWEERANIWIRIFTNELQRRKDPSIPLINLTQEEKKLIRGIW